MERVQVTSSNISSIGYDSDSQVLEVEFLGGSVYQYYGVPDHDHRGIMDSDSKGGYLNANIKGRYSFSKL